MLLNYFQIFTIYWRKYINISNGYFQVYYLSFYIKTILQDFVDTCSKKRGEVKAELISSKELSGEQVIKIKDELSQNFNAKIKLDYKYDKSLIGGLVIQVGSIMVDTSIKNKLQQIENTMIEA